MSRPGTSSSPRAASAFDRLAAAFILTLLVAGCFTLWLGIPAGGMWLAAQVTSSFGLHMPVALLLAVSGMLAWAMGLSWLDRLYLRVTGGETVRSGDAEIRRRGPLEPLLIASLLLAFAAFVVWFLAFAENPNLAVW